MFELWHHHTCVLRMALDISKNDFHHASQECELRVYKHARIHRPHTTSAFVACVCIVVYCAFLCACWLRMYLDGSVYVVMVHVSSCMYSGGVFLYDVYVWWWCS